MRDKPIYLWPFICVYKIVIFICKIPLALLHYLLLGFFFTFYFIIDILISSGVLISKLWYKFLKYFVMGISFPFVWTYRKIANSSGNDEDAIKKLEADNKKEILAHNKKLAKLKKQEEIKLAKEKADLAKIEAERKIAEEKKQKEEQQQELKEQQRLIKLEKEKEAMAKAEKVKEDIIVEKEIDAKREENKEKVLSKKEQKALKKKELLEAKKKLKEEALKRKKELKAEKKKLKENDSYVNENAVIEKKSLGDQINAGLETLIGIPKKLSKKLKEAYENSTFVKNKKNKESMKREALLIDFNGEDAEKSDKKVVYEYVGKNADGKLIKSYFEAFSKVEVHSFLLSEGFEVYSIKTSKWIQFLHGSKQASHVKFKTKDLLFFLTQLSTYIKAGIPLVESLRILSRQFENKSYQKLFRAMIYDLTMGDNFSDAMGKQGESFPKILVNMVKASEMTGELPETLDDMAEYFTESDKTRKQMITAMTYPTIIFVLAIAAVSFIMIYIVPKFTDIYASMDNAELPGITVFITDLSHFLATNYLYLIIGIVIIVIGFRYLYKSVKLFRTLVQYVLMHTPVIKNIIIYNEVTMFTKTFASLLRHNVFITDTMEILNKITNNEIWKMIILDTITNLAKGEKISTAFKEHWAVPLPAYEMIVTGERTGQLPEMMQKVSDYYQELHKNAVGRIKSFVEPILILFLTGVVGLIVLSIVIPMFGMYDNIN